MVASAVRWLNVCLLAVGLAAIGVPPVAAQTDDRASAWVQFGKPNQENGLTLRWSVRELTTRGGRYCHGTDQTRRRWGLHFAVDPEFVHELMPLRVTVLESRDPPVIQRGRTGFGRFSVHGFPTAKSRIRSISSGGAVDPMRAGPALVSSRSSCEKSISSSRAARTKPASQKYRAVWIWWSLRCSRNLARRGKTSSGFPSSSAVRMVPMPA